MQNYKKYQYGFQKGEKNQSPPVTFFRLRYEFGHSVNRQRDPIPEPPEKRNQHGQSQANYW